MPARDPKTLAFYAHEAETYSSRDRSVDHSRMDRFLELLPEAGKILELGCGAGQDSAAMLARGFDVTPTDGSPELARQAEKRLGRPVRVLLFDDLDEPGRYHGVWARACLLHVPQAALPHILRRVHTALTAGGTFYASFKAGTREGRDRFQRFYNYPSAAWLRQAYGEGWSGVDIEEATGGGYDGVPTDWLHVVAHKLS